MLLRIITGITRIDRSPSAKRILNARFTNHDERMGGQNGRVKIRDELG